MHFSDMEIATLKLDLFRAIIVSQGSPEHAAWLTNEVFALLFGGPRKPVESVEKAATSKRRRA